LFRVYRIRDVVRIDPSKLEKPLESVVIEELRKRYEGLVDERLGYVIAIRNLKINPEGVFVMGDGAPYFVVEFDVLGMTPIIGEITPGIVEMVTRSGLMVRIGPVEGFLHVSQVSDEPSRFDSSRNVMVVGEKRKSEIGRDDILKVKIISIGFKASQLRVALTMRQPYLGKVSSW